MTDLFIILTAMIICAIVSILWYSISRSIAQGFSSREDMTIPIFIAGMAAFTLVSIIILIVMIVWWF